MFSIWKGTQLNSNHTTPCQNTTFLYLILSIIIPNVQKIIKEKKEKLPSASSSSFFFFPQQSWAFSASLSDIFWNIIIIRNKNYLKFYNSGQLSSKYLVCSTIKLNLVKKKKNWSIIKTEASRNCLPGQKKRRQEIVWI